MAKTKSGSAGKAKKGGSVKARKSASAKSKKPGPAKKAGGGAAKPAKARASGKRDQVCDGEIDLQAAREVKSRVVVPVGEAEPAARGRSRAAASASEGARSPITITFGANAREGAVTELSRQVLLDIMRASGLTDLLITSTSRSPAEQARAMFNNIVAKGVAHQKRLYGPSGDKVIDVFVASKRAGKTDAQIKADMERKIIEIGPSKVSRHASDPNVLCVVDIAPSSIRRRAEFERAVKAERRVSKFFKPPDDPAYHLEIPQT